MPKAPYVLVELQLLDFESEKFDKFYETFLRLSFREDLLCYFTLDKTHHTSKVIIKLVQRANEQDFGVLELLELELFQKFLAKLDSYFAMKPSIMAHVGKTKKQLIPVLEE